MKIILDLSKVSPACKEDVIKAIRRTLQGNADRIREDLIYFGYTPGEKAHSDMSSWRDEAEAVIRDLNKQVKDQS